VTKKRLEDRWQIGLTRRTRDGFFPPYCFEATGLEKGVGHNAKQSMPLQPDPRSPLEVIEAKFFLELLMGLLADPSLLDRLNEVRERRIGQ